MNAIENIESVVYKMGKSKYGINLAFVAVLCLIFAILHQPLLVVLICAYSVLFEKNEWLNKHVLYTLIIMVCYMLVQFILSGTFGFLVWFINLVGSDADITILYIGNIFSIIVRVLFILFYIFNAYIAATGKEVKSTFMNKLVSRISE